MIRFFEYRCPVHSVEYANDPIMATCRYEWNFDLGDSKPCVGCGKTYEETRTIWDKINNIYWTVVPYNLRPKNLWYNIKCWAWHRYSTVKPRTIEGHQWVDRCHLLPHMVFEILCDFVEKELIPSFKTINWDSDEDHIHARDEMLALYRWWTEEYDEEYVYNLSDEEFDKQYPWTMPADYDGTIEQRRHLERYNADIIYKKLLLDNCKRVIDVSPYMWT